MSLSWHYHCSRIGRIHRVNEEILQLFHELTKNGPGRILDQAWMNILGCPIGHGVDRPAIQDSEGPAQVEGTVPTLALNRTSRIVASPRTFHGHCATLTTMGKGLTATRRRRRSHFFESFVTIQGQAKTPVPVPCDGHGHGSMYS